MKYWEIYKAHLALFFKQFIVLKTNFELLILQFHLQIIRACLYFWAF